MVVAASGYTLYTALDSPRGARSMFEGIKTCENRQLTKGLKFILSLLSGACPVKGLLLVVWLTAMAGAPAQAEHRATRLGHPATRFAPPLTKPEQLRQLLTSERLRSDVAAILRQAGWPGNLEDLRRAAATAEITEVKLPKGTRLPFMSSRTDGKPIALIDVLWVGEDPIDAYEFQFSSSGRRYRCVTPKPCSNFLVIDLGPDQPTLSLVKIVPASSSLCQLIPVTITVRNTCTRPLTRVRVADILPAGLRTVDNQATVILDAGDLQPGAGREFTFTLTASAAGKFVSRAQATSAEGANAEATATTVVRAPVLALECAAPAEVLIGRPIEVCLTVKNTGEAAEPKATLTLPVPAGATLTKMTEGGVTSEGKVIWDISSLAPQASRRFCAVLVVPQSGSLPLAPTVQGVCAPPAESHCLTRVVGVPAVLIEVIDLEDPVEVGNQATYEIRILNQGSEIGTNLRLLCTLPDSQEFVSGGGVTPAQARDRTVLMAPLATLASRAEATWRVTVKALKSEDARFKVEFTSDQFTRPIDEYESTTQY